MENINNVLSSIKFAEIRIDLAKNFPVTIYSEHFTNKKSARTYLNDIISAEDLPQLINQIDDILAGNESTLQSHSRIKSDVEYRWFLIRGELKKEKFGKIHLVGFLFDVSDYLEFAGEDKILLEFKKKSAEKAGRINNRELTLTDIVDVDYLSRIQTPLAEGGVLSAIFHENGELICAAGDEEKIAKIKKQKFTKRVDIRISRAIAAYWIIGSHSEDIIEKNEPLLEILSQTVSRIANSFVVLYNEMNNSERANKMLGEHIEQQILINNVYNLILERKSSSGTLEAVIKLVGEYMGMSRITVYNDFPAEKKMKLRYSWQHNPDDDSAFPVLPYNEIPHIIERLDYTDMYIPSEEHRREFEVETCVAASLNADGKRFGIIMFIPRDDDYVPTAQEGKILRSISQITATVILQRQSDEMLEETAKRIRYLAFYDPILDIPNRAMLDSDLENELKSGNHGAAVAVKITNIRTFNELFGHDYSDNMLRDVAHYIVEIPSSNITVYRFSGNTLMFLLRKTDEMGTQRLIETLLFRFAKPWVQKSGEHYLDTAIGITVFPGERNTREEIYRSCTLALYKALEYGANSYAFYSQEFDKPAGLNYNNAQRLRDSIKNNMKGFSLKYQPVVDLDGKILSHEAFVCWNDLPTTKLVHLAENMGFDIVLDAWVLKHACAFCKKMQETDPGFSVSVNITSRELRSGAVVSMIKDALSEADLDSSCLSVEIPERVFSGTQDGVLPIMKKLSQIGIKLIIDSFGSDFGGLRLLKHSYVDMVKIDFSLFTNIFSEFDEIWVNTVAKLSQTIKNGICVKRIENEEQFETVKKFGINSAQGFLFDKPAPEEEIIRRLSKTVKL